MKRLVFLLTICCLLVAGNSFAAGTVTYDLNNVQDTRDYQELTFSWVGDGSDGTVPDKTTTETIHGYIIKVCTTIVLSATDNYDVYIEDANGADLLEAGGENRDTTVAECVSFTDKPRRVDSTLTLDLDNNSDTTSQGIIDVVILMD